ncbi:MAG: hypothetical protein CM1200mP3_13690 [Chloroflexota bacterium]|nr:MAG: hypothetical protein CM1200mP3_13690 [Chloroflexota bacterium]
MFHIKGDLNLVRIERGIPESGFELTEEYNPLEVNPKNHISFNKGCYVGQEVVARLDTYDKVKRRLVGLTWRDEMIFESGANIFYDGDNIGTLTSTTKSPKLVIYWTGSGKESLHRSRY